MDETDRPPVAMTSGDPAGIGPELAVAAWRRLGRALPFFWIGDPAHLAPGAPVVEISRPGEAARAAERGLPVLAHPFPAAVRSGLPDPHNAAAVVEVIDRAVALVRAGEASAVTTAPISKKVLIDGANFGFPGHTEYLAHLAGVPRVAMMLTGAGLRVVPTTIHIPLAEVPGALTPLLLEETLRLVHAALRTDFGLAAPRIAVAGLNPHAGEGGAMGREEIETIAPVLDLLRGEGMLLDGPRSADTMFHAAARAGYDAAVMMYHDQALIPLKALAFDEGVNVTLGLPFVRTSPDHGTAFGIAGTGQANPASTIEALRMAARLSDRRA